MSAAGPPQGTRPPMGGAARSDARGEHTSAADDELAAYVDAASAAAGLTLAPDERARVLGHFVRLATFARALDEVKLPPHIEIAPVFRP
jgi:1-carboxybiuret hydrolase subunit AtzG-like